MTFSSNVIIASVVPTIKKFGFISEKLGRDATAVYHGVAGLTPPDKYSYGRYFDSGNPLLQFQPFAGSVTDMIAAGTTLRETLHTALVDLVGTATNDDLSLLGTSLFAAYDALVACCGTPADSINLCFLLAGFKPPVLNAGSDTIGHEMSDLAARVAVLVRIAALINLAKATSIYVPTSSQDAIDLRNQVAAQFDDEILRLASWYDDDDVAALSALRTAVVTDLNARGSQLKPVVNLTFKANLPSLVLAFKLYGDNSVQLEPDLVARNDVPCAGFLPLEIEALSS